MHCILTHYDTLVCGCALFQRYKVWTPHIHSITASAMSFFLFFQVHHFLLSPTGQTLMMKLPCSIFDCPKIEQIFLKVWYLNLTNAHNELRMNDYYRQSDIPVCCCLLTGLGHIHADTCPAQHPRPMIHVWDLLLRLCAITALSSCAGKQHKTEWSLSKSNTHYTSLGTHLTP